MTKIFKKKTQKLDDFDLDNLDMDFPDASTFEADLSSEAKSDDRTPVSKAFGTLTYQAKERITNPSYIKDFILKALPSEYEDAFDLASNIKDTTVSEYNKSVSQIKPAIGRLARSADTI